MKFLDYDKQKRIAVFERNITFIHNNQWLNDSIKKSVEKGKIYKENDLVIPNITSRFITTNIEVCNCRSLEAIETYKEICPISDYRYAVLNFASAKNPGGFVAGGASAQEECLCRCSTLYHVLSDKKFSQDYYNYHKSLRGMDSMIYTDRIIYTPNITVFCKDQKFPEIMYNVDWNIVDVITSPAPNLIHIYERYSDQVNEEFLMRLYESRIEKIILSAMDNNVSILVLGAWGCGVFKNDPKLVAKAFRCVLIEHGLGNNFAKVIFAIVDDHRGRVNYRVFKEVLEK